MEKIIKLDENNIDEEHICCAFSDKKCQEWYQSKKDWLKSQFKEWFVFKKLDVRWKAFIEYVPVENAWCPIDAPNYMFIHCFWVSGQFAGKGNWERLYKECLNDAKAQWKDWIVVVTWDKKRPFMSDKKFFKKQWFELADKAEPYFELWYMKLNDKAPTPKFKECAKKWECDNKDGLTVYYTNGCPFTEYYVNTELVKVAKDKWRKLKVVKIDTKEKAQNHFVPYLNYSIFNNGKFVTQHILNDKYFDKFITD